MRKVLAGDQKSATGNIFRLPGFRTVSHQIPARFIRFLSLIVISLICESSLYPQGQPVKSTTDFSDVRKLIQTQMSARRIPSISVAVARHGQIVWEEAFGFADKE